MLGLIGGRARRPGRKVDDARVVRRRLAAHVLLADCVEVFVRPAEEVESLRRVGLPEPP